jgi:hypothetical protein
MAHSDDQHNAQLSIDNRHNLYDCTVIFSEICVLISHNIFALMYAVLHTVSTNIACQAQMLLSMIFRLLTEVQFKQEFVNWNLSFLHKADFAESG